MAEDTFTAHSAGGKPPFFQCEEIIYPGNDRIRCLVGTPSALPMPHWHIDHEIVLILSGQAEIVVDGNRRLLESGGLVFVNMMSTHSIEAISEGVLVEIIHFDPSLLNLAVSGNRHAGDYYFDFSTAHVEERIMDFLRSETALVGDLYYSMHSEQRLGISAELLKLLVTMFKYKLVSRLDASKGPQGGRSNIFRVFEYFKVNYANPAISLEHISDELSIPTGNVTALLKETTGCSFSKFLSKLRIEEAKKMLAHMSSDITVLDVAENCGFTSLPTFYRTFKQYTGVNPGDYMKQKKDYFIQRAQTDFTELDAADAEDMLRNYVRALRDG